MKYAHLLISFLLITSLSCSKDNNSVTDTAGQKNYNLSYGSDPRNKIDVYLPANRSSQTPFVLFIHGGGWVAGDKADMNVLQDSFMKRGIASASMSYRYASAQIHYHELMQDVAAALEYCYSNSDSWNIRKDKYIIGGVSAGAHMSLLYAYSYDASGRIGAVISAAGPTDITQTDWLNYAAGIGLLDAIEKMVGASYISGQPLNAKFVAASPRYHVKNKPTLMLHGTNDVIVPYTQSQALAADLSNAGITHKLVTFQNTGHDLGLANPVYYQLLLTEIENWCKTYGR